MRYVSVALKSLCQSSKNNTVSNGDKQHPVEMKLLKKALFKERKPHTGECGANY